MLQILFKIGVAQTKCVARQVPRSTGFAPVSGDKGVAVRFVYPQGEQPEAGV